MEKVTLQKRIFVFYSLLLILLSLIIAGITYNVYNKIIIKQIGQSRVDVLKQIAERTEMVKNTMTHVSNAFCTNEEIVHFIIEKEMTEKMQKSFDNLADDTIEKTNNVFQSRGFEFGFSVYASNGLNYATFSKGDEYGFEDVKNELWYKDVLKKEDEINWISSSYTLEDKKYSTVSAVRLLKDINQTVIGAVIINIDEAFLKDTYKSIMSGDSDIYIVDENGKIVSNNDENMLGLKYFSMSRLNKMVKDAGFSLVQNSQEQRLISSYSDPRLGWTIVELIETKGIFLEVHKVALFILLLVILSVIIAVTLSYYFAKKTVTPLLDFEKDIEKVQQGDISVISTVKGWRELSQIRDAFNKMIGEIQLLLKNIKLQEKEKHQIKLEFLQAQINPHFLYNTLFSSKCLIGMGKNEQAEKMITNLIALLRMVLNKDGDVVTLAKELEYTRKYIDIQKYRYEDKFELYIECDDRCKQAVIPKLIIQPIVENAIFHGIESKEGSGTIVISASILADDLYLSICDDGIGMSQEKMAEIMNGKQARTHKEFNMIGVYNIKQRIALNYGEAYGVTIKSEEDLGTTISIKLPYITEEDYETESIDCG